MYFKKRNTSGIILLNIPVFDFLPESPFFRQKQTKVCARTLLRHARERLDQLQQFQHRRANFDVGLFFFSCKAFLELEKRGKEEGEECHPKWVRYKVVQPK